MPALFIVMSSPWPSPGRAGSRYATQGLALSSVAAADDADAPTMASPVVMASIAAPTRTARRRRRSLRNATMSTPGGLAAVDGAVRRRLTTSPGFATPATRRLPLGDRAGQDRRDGRRRARAASVGLSRRFG